MLSKERNQQDRELSLLIRKHGLNLQPEKSAQSLKEAIARRYAVELNNVIIGAGSSDLIRALLFFHRSKLSKPVGLFPPTFRLYSQIAKACGIRVNIYRVKPILS